MAIDDEPARLAALQAALAPVYILRTATSVRDAIQLLRTGGPIDALIIDQTMPDRGDLALIRYVYEMLEKPDKIVKILISESGPSARARKGLEAILERIDRQFDRTADPAEIKRALGALLAQKSKEKRRIMRAAFDRSAAPEVEIGDLLKASVLNIGEDGMFIKNVLPKDDLLPLKIHFPGSPPLLASGRVIRVDEELGGVGVKFLVIEDVSRDIIVDYISSRMMNGNLTDLKVRYPFLHVDRIVPFTDQTKIMEWLTQALRSQAEFTAICPAQKAPANLRLRALDPRRFCEFSGQDLDVRFKTSDSLFISFQAGYATYNFETLVYQIAPDGTSLEVLFPRIIFYSEKRSAKRTFSDGRLVAEIELPDPFSGSIRGEITDISEGGVSFIAPALPVALLIGTPLEAIRIFNENLLVRDVRGEVRNVLKSDGDGADKLRYGVQFGIGRRTFLATELSGQGAPADLAKAPTPEKLESVQRRQADLIELAKQPPRVIRLENRKGEEIVGLLNSSLPLENDPLPVVIIPPAFGKTKETLFALAQTIVENFRIRSQPIAVIRFDGIRCKGESFKDPDASEPPYETIHSSLSQGAEDIRAILDWLQLNPILKASAVVLVSFSLSALEARIVLRDEAYRRQISHWITCMGTMEFRELMNRVNCGLDLLEQHQLGVDLGIIPILGNLISMKPFAADVIANRVATLDQAREDMGHIDIPITWIYGTHDHWVKPEFVRDIMSVHADASREVISLPIGHNARTSDEALQLFATVTILIHRFLSKDSIEPILPDKKNMEIMRRAEQDRIPARKIKSRKEYWERYLVGERNLIGFDVMALSEDYQGLMRDQLDALDLRPGDRLLDLGGGTGNLIEFVLSHSEERLARVTIADLVPEAMKKASRKLKARFAHDRAPILLDLVCLDVELSRYLPVRRFLNGEIDRFATLSGRIEHLPRLSAEIIDAGYSSRLHRILRGEAISSEIDRWLKATFDLPEYRIIVDFNQAARHLRARSSAPLAYRTLGFEVKTESALHLPFKDASYDKIAMSLVLSYIFNPIETLIDLKRVLAPGGRLVLSSMRPDADASGLFTRLMDRIEALSPEEFPPHLSKTVILDSMRSFLNDAQALVDLEEAGTFDFFEPDQLDDLLDEAGWDRLESRPSFGAPPQGYVVTAKVRQPNG